jgi:hypothetical protein
VSLWEFENVTREWTFHLAVKSLTIANQQPCQLATLGALVEDPGDDYLFAGHDHLKARFNSVLIFNGNVSRYVEADITGHDSPKLWRLTARDRTARLKRDVITVNRDRSETITQRVVWLMGESTQGFSLNIAAIADEVEPLESAGMNLLDALEATASECGASFYVDYDDVFQFFVEPPGGAAPFGLIAEASGSYNPVTDPPFEGFAIDTDVEPQANAVLVRGDGVKAWSEDAASIATYGRIEKVINDPSIKRLRRAQRVGASELLRVANPVRNAHATLWEPGLLPMQEIPIDYPQHNVDETWIVGSTVITYLNPTMMQMAVDLADRFRPCRERQPGAKVDSGDDDDGGDGGGGGVPSDCVDCLRVTVLTPDGMDEAIALASGAANPVYGYSSANDMVVKYRCGLEHVWTNTRTGSDPLNFAHEAGTRTPVLVAPYAVQKADGETKWNRSAEFIPAASAAQDRTRFWTVAEGSGGSVVPPVGGYGTFDLSEGPAASPVILWRCFVDAAGPLGGAPLRFSWGDSEIYKGIVGGPFQSIDVGVRFYGNDAWNDPDTPPDEADILGFFGAGDPPGTRIFGGFYVGQQFEDWTPITAGSSTPATTVIGTGRWVVLYAYTRIFGGGAVDDGGYRGTLTVSDNGTGDDLELVCDSGVEAPVESQLQVRNSDTGALIDSIALDELTTQIRATPNAQHVFLMHDTGTFTRYDRVLTLEDTITIAGFTTGLQEWNVDDDFNIYRCAGNVVTKYNRDGEELWAKDANAAEGFTMSTRGYSEPTGQAMFIDEHVRLVGVDGDEAMLLTLGRRLGNVRSAQRFGGDCTAEAIAGIRISNCIVLAGSADGDEFEDVDLGGELRGWLMRIKAALAE